MIFIREAARSLGKQQNVNNNSRIGSFFKIAI